VAEHERPVRIGSGLHPHAGDSGRSLELEHA
jgi:hypothetical protein